MVNPLPDDKFYTPSKLKELADDKNGRKLSKQVENTVGKGEIACFPGVSKGVIVWEWVKPIRSSVSFNFGKHWRIRIGMF